MRLLKAIFWFFMQLKAGRREMFWEEFLAEAERKYKEGNSTYVRRMLEDWQADRDIRMRIVQMLVQPEVMRPPAWLRFDHVIDTKTPKGILVFISDTINVLQQQAKCVFNNENARTFRSIVECKPRLRLV